LRFLFRVFVLALFLYGLYLIVMGWYIKGLIILALWALTAFSLGPSRRGKAGGE